jgi:uncharacterized protein
VPTVERVVAWKLTEGVGLELAFARIQAGRLRARGLAIRMEPSPHELRYTLATTTELVTRRLVVAATGVGWTRSLDLRRRDDGSWTCAGRASGTLDAPIPGCEASELHGALDCDLGLSPLTNTMPVLRHGLLEPGPPVELLMAWVSVPDLRVHSSRQRYEFVRQDGERRMVRYGGGERGPSYDIAFDGDGLVIDYPGLARRVGG